MPRETKLTLVIMLLVMGTFGVIVWQKVSKDQTMVAELKRRAHELWAGTSATKSDEPVAPPKVAKNDPNKPKPSAQGGFSKTGQTTLTQSGKTTKKPAQPNPWKQAPPANKPGKSPKPTFADLEKNKHQFEPLNGNKNQEQKGKANGNSFAFGNQQQPPKKPEVTFDLFEQPKQKPAKPKGSNVAQAPPAQNPWAQNDPFGSTPTKPKKQPSTQQTAQQDPFGFPGTTPPKQKQKTVAQNDPTKDLFDFFNTSNEQKPKTQQASFQQPGKPKKPQGNGFQADPFGTPQFEQPTKPKKPKQQQMAQQQHINDPFAFPNTNQTGKSQFNTSPQQQTNNGFPGSNPNQQSPMQQFPGNQNSGQPGSSFPPGYAQQKSRPNTFDQFPQINSPHTQFDYPSQNQNQSANQDLTFQYGNQNPNNNQQPPKNKLKIDVYEVGAADSYWNISSMAYGTSRYFQALAEFNRHRISNPKKLKPGMKVLLPDAEELDRLYPKLTGFHERAMKDPNLRQVGLFRDQKGIVYYRVAEEDSLSSIAQKHLGRASRWIEIFQLNRAILKNPQKVKVDMVLRMPSDSSNLQVLD